MTLYKREQLTQKVLALTGVDSSEISPPHQGGIIDDAFSQHSARFPRTCTEVVHGRDSAYLPLSDLDGWEDGVSSIISVEYPAQDMPTAYPIFVPTDQRNTDYHDGSERYLMMRGRSPKTTEKVRISYKRAYRFNADDEIDLNQTELSALTQLCASLFCQVVANRYARTSDPSISADSVDHGSRFHNFNTAAKTYFKRYEQIMNTSLMSPNGAVKSGAGGEFVEWPSSKRLSGRRRLFHG